VLIADLEQFATRQVAERAPQQIEPATSRPTGREGA